MKKKNKKKKTKQKTGKFERYFKNSARRKIIALRPKKLDVHRCLQSEWYYVSAGYLKFAKKKKTRTLSMLCFSVSCFFLIALFSWEMIYTTSQSLIFLCFFFFFQAPLQADQPLSGKWTRLPHEKTLLGAKQDPTEGATKIKPIFCYTVHFYTLRLIFPREAKEKESARGTMGRRKVIASSYWDTQQELRRENHPCGTFLDCYDF